MRNSDALLTHIQPFESRDTDDLVRFIARYAPRWSEERFRAQLSRTHDALTRLLAEEDTPNRAVYTAQRALLDAVFAWMDAQTQQPMEVNRANTV